MNNRLSSAVVIAVTVVAVVSIISLTLIFLTVQRSELPEGWLALFFGFLSSLVVTIVGLVKTDQMSKKVDDLANGRMDAKIRAGVADVISDDMIDPAAEEQIKADRERREQH